MTSADLFPEPTVMWATPNADQAGKPLLILLHGYGANENDLLSLAEMLPDAFAVASVRAPLDLGSGFSWFPLTAALDFSIDAVNRAADHLETWLDGIRANHSSVTLLGFSQGMAMATTLLRRRPSDYAAVVGLSGFVVDVGSSTELGAQDDLLSGSVPFFWGRDQQDPVIPADKIDYTMAWLRPHVKLTKVLYTGMWHGINAQEIGHVGEFLTHEVLKG